MANGINVSKAGEANISGSQASASCRETSSAA